ncbi:sodium/calcium exchanger Calx-like isoform X2 [Centruroides vittatus]|uniref:sodium/calcium exchanger Calx-like isoform X2 n=1 Tax=Centruroides vittatus TaxID=120091 RepID=UPI00350FB18E
MECNSSSLDNYLCSDKGLLLPLINEYTWSRGSRAFLYLLGLIYCFLGVAIIADIFMCSIEKITSKTRKIVLSTVNDTEPEVLEVKIWNDTVANLTLMALGSSAPEILLSIIEIIGNRFEAGELGPGTIVGSAAFNLFVICAVCITAIPPGEFRRIRMINVFMITAFFSIFAYLWLLVVLLAITPERVEVWEALITLLFFPILVILSYCADRNFCMGKKVLQQKQLELESSKDMANRSYFPRGRLDRDNLISFIKEIRKNPGLSEEDAACLAASRLVEEKDHSRMWYRVGAIRSITGGRKPKPKLSEKLREVYDAMLTDEEGKQLRTVAKGERQDISIIEFTAASCAIMENAGRVNVSVRRHGKTNNKVSCKFETIDGTAVSGEDYIEKKELIVFQPNETEKKIFVEIVNDNQWEPDETFFLKLSLCEDETEEVALGRTCIMEITILNDDEPGILQFKRRGLLVKESVGVVYVPVIRKQGADGIVSCKWRTIDKSAMNGRDFKGGEGELVFQHAEIEKNIEIPIIDDFDAEKDEHFEIEILEPKGGAKLGQINRTTITITNDDDFNSIMGRLMVMTNVNIDSLRLQSETWVEQLKDAMNVNGGDLENATRIDYILHFITFGWKIIFALVPPTAILGGWLTFVVSLIAIGILTAIIGDMASIFGCLVGLEDTVTAITFVALGTSLPDLFASKAAATQEKYADNAIGNVTGSNSVNVFLGVGLPWVIASIYWESRGEIFKVKAGTLGFSVGIYSAAAFVCIGLLMMRRCLKRCGGGELGGSKVLAHISAGFMIFLWILYIVLSSLKAYNHL